MEGMVSKMKRNRIPVRLLCILFALALLPFAAACGDKEESSAETSAESVGESSEPERELFSNLPDVTFGGATVTFLVEGDYMDTYASVEVMPQESSYSTLKDAIQTRNDLVEEHFDVEIAEVRTENYGEMLTKLRDNAMTGVSQYDIVMPYMGDAASFAQEGNLLDLRTLENVHLDESYYDQGSVQDLSINHKNYFVTGDLSLLCYDVTHVLVFNKDTVTNYNLENPYDLVREKKFTLDKLREMAKQVTADTDGEAGMGHLDTYGFLVNRNFVSSMFIGAGQRFSVKNENDEPEIAVYSEQAVKVFDKIFTLVNDETAAGQIDNTTGGFGASATKAGKTVWDAAREATANKRTLFHAVSLSGILALGEYDCNFGILPVPMLSDDQERYYCRVSTLYASCAAIPINVKDVEMSSIIMDAMFQASTDTVKTAYIDTIMKQRKIQDHDSEDMMDIIFESRVYDFGTVFNWGGTSEYDVGSITGFMNDIAFSGSNTFVSKWDSIKNKVQSDLDATIEAYRRME